MTTRFRPLLVLIVPALVLGLWLGGPAVAEDAPAPAATQAAPATETARVPMLWEVDTQPKIYLFGTIHLGDPRVLAHPPVVQKALDRSQALYTEIAIEPETMMKMAQMARLPEGQSLKEILPPALREKVRGLLAAKGLPEPMLDALDRFQIWALFLQLQRLDVPPEMLAKALDSELYTEAMESGKTVGGIEKLEEQIGIFASLTQEEQIRLLDESVKAILKAREAGVQPVQQMIELYLKGDAESLMKAMMAEMDKDDPLSNKLMKMMLDDRNVRMVRRMLQIGQERPDETMFVAVGTGHYPGAMGILELLRTTGFRVRQLKSIEDMDKPWPLVAPTSPDSRCAPRARRMIRVGPFCIPDPCCR